MRANLRLLLTLLAMSLVMFFGVIGYEVFHFERSYKHDFLAEKTTFGEQVARIALSGMQTSNYFELYRLGNELYRADSMQYIAIIDDAGQMIHLRAGRDAEKVQAERLRAPREGVRTSLNFLGEQVVLIRSPIHDDVGKRWGSVEISYYWAPARRMVRNQIGAFTTFFLVFVSVWGVVLFFSARSILSPLDRFVRSLEQIQAEWPVSLEQFNARLVPEKATSDVTVLLNVLRTSLVRLLEYEKAQRQEAEFSALGRLAAQVAHDIRSPLAALDSASSSSAQLAEEKRILIRSAIGRIRDIANNLIGTYQRSTAGESVVDDGGKPSRAACEPQQSHLLPSLVDSVISEKRQQFRSKIRLEIDYRLEPSAYGAFADVHPAEFQRVLSNLINNAVEALGERGGIIVRLARANGQILLEVRDDGKGIPPEILGRLGRRGETHGKAEGSGLGLFHAKTSVESWGGTLEIRSEVGKGTTVSLRLPQAQPPEWFVPKLELVRGDTVLVLDDDTSIHHVWQGRFDSLGPVGQALEVWHFSTPVELRDWVKADVGRARKAVYLMDYELMGHEETGLTLMAELGLGERSILVTSRFEEKAILEECVRLKARMLPKSLAGFVPISIVAEERPSRSSGAVLVDDDPLVRMTWKMAAQAKGIDLAIFGGSKEFLSSLDDFAKDTAIYLDSELGEGRRGEDVARDLHAKGFTNLFLATGHPPETLSAMPWIKKIVGKEPPWT